MADRPKAKKSKTFLSDDVVERMRARLINGDTGYGRPPKEHQFKKGQRANPRGRPRTAAPDLKLSEQPLLSAIESALNQSVRGQDGAKAVEMSAAQALAQKALGFALKGNARYFGILVDMGRQAEEARAREIQASLEIWESYQIATRSLIDDATQKGEPLPDFLPHPDDIILDTKEGPRFVGPCGEDELKRMQETLRMRDVLLMQDVLDQRSTMRLNGQPLREPGGALLFAMVLDKSLPPRLRMSNADMMAKQCLYDRMTKRELQKSLRRKWGKLGRQVPRGFVSCDLSVVKVRLDFVAEFVRLADEDILDLEAMANGDFDATAQSFFGRHGIPVDGL